MLAVRALEVKHQLNDVTEKILAVLPEVKQSAEKWLEETEALASVEARLQECHQQMALIKEIEAYGDNLKSHPLYAISQKYTSYKQAKNAVEDSMKAIVKILKDYDTQIENFESTNEALNGPQLMQWVQEFSGPQEDDEQPIFDHIKEFLTNAGQSSMIAQCEQAETELNQSIKQTNLLVRSCLELLTQHVAVSQFYPRSHTEYYRIVMFRKWLAAALESKSPEVCREVASQVTAMINADNVNPNSSAAQQIIAYNYRLQAISAEANVNLNKSFERLQSEANPEAIAAAQETYREAKANISNWVRTEEGAGAALESVVVGMLCNLNRRYLMLENGAQSAGDCLVDLTSREGEWFLDDMSALSNQAVELLSLLPLQSASAEDASLPAAVECVRNVNLLLADLVQLNENFCTIILPEALKKVLTEDPSALQMISELNAVIMNSPVPLNEILAQLEMHIRYLVMDMESPAGSCQVLASELRARYEALLAGGGGEAGGGGSETAGRMLLMGFNGLFAAVEQRTRDLGPYLAAPVPPAWRKIDHISEALHMSAALQNGALRSVLEDLFLVRRVQTVAEVFALCTQEARAFRGAAEHAPLDGDALCKPVRRFTAQFVSRCVLGVGSRALAAVLCLLLRRAHLDLRAEVEQKEIGASWSVPLEALCEKAAGARSSLAPRAAALLRGWGGGGGGGGAGAAAARRHARASLLAHGARLRLQAHRQLHAEVLGGGGETCAALARRARELSAAGARLQSALTRTHALLAAAHQRVKWGAGANPALLGPLRALEAAWGARGGAARAAAAAVSGRAARSLRQALAHWEKACTLAQKYALDVSPVEESLMEMLHPEGNIDAQWVSNVAALLRDMCAALGAEAAERRVRAAAGWGGAGAALQPLHAARTALLQDVAAPLLALQPLYEGVNPAAQCLSWQRDSSALLSQLVSAAPGRPAALPAAADALAHQLPRDAAALAQVANTWALEGGARRSARSVAAPAARHGGRNAVGAVVWRRVRLKLEAREPHAESRASLREQVEYIISEATSADNLCMMYEGWMAWV